MVVLCVAIAAFVGYEVFVAKAPVATLPPGTPPRDAAILNPRVTPEDIAQAVAAKTTRTLRAVEANRWLGAWVVSPGWQGTLESVVQVGAGGAGGGAGDGGDGVGGMVLVVRIEGLVRSEAVMVHVHLVTGTGRAPVVGQPIRVGGRIAGVGVIEPRAGGAGGGVGTGEEDAEGALGAMDEAGASGEALVGETRRGRELRVTLRDGRVME